MPARKRKSELKPHTDAIIDLLARFKTHEHIVGVLADKGVTVAIEDILPFTSGKYPKMIAKRTAEIVAKLPIVNLAYRMMMLNELMGAVDASTSDKLAAIRACTTMLKKENIEESAEDLLKGDD